MAHEVTLLGKFLGLRAKNPDTVADPYDPFRESPLQLDLPNHDLTFSRPAPLPLPPLVTLSTPNTLPVPPAVELSSPAVLPAELAPPQLYPANLPPPPGVIDSIPGNLPLPPQVIQTLPTQLPPPPAILPTLRTQLPAPPPFQPVRHLLLPPVPNVQLSSPSILPPPPEVQKTLPTTVLQPTTLEFSKPSELPTPEQEIARANPNLQCVPGDSPDPKKVNPVATPDSGYFILPELYSPLGGASPGNLAGDPFMYERQAERFKKGVGPGKIALHALEQVGLFAQNVYGTVWNPVLIAPPPGLGDLTKPALDLLDGNTEERQVQIGSLVDSVLNSGDPYADTRLLPGRATIATEPQLSRLRPRTNAQRAFDNAKSTIVNGFSNFIVPRDTLQDTAFANGIIPMRLKGDNKFGFRTFREGQGDKTTDDSVYLPLCFTDLRPIGDTFRTVYFRPIIKSLNESLAAEWNKAQYHGRVDPVATYMSTTRTINLSFELIAFGPEDVKTIYQKLHWLSSMVYPEYDSNLNFRSGPVVRMRVGDVINAAGKEGSRGLSGIIESIDYDYSESIWELKENFKLPRSVKVSLAFTVLHDRPMGRGTEGMFGGLGSIKNGIFSVPEGGKSDESTAADPGSYRTFGQGTELLYNTLASADSEVEK